MCFLRCSVRIDKVRLDVALELSKYLSKETKVMAVQQGFSELVPLYKLMEKRDMFDFVNQMKVGQDAARSLKHAASRLKALTPISENFNCNRSAETDLFQMKQSV